MKLSIPKIATRSITCEVAYPLAFAYLADPMNQPNWAVHFVRKVEQTDSGYLATLPFGTLPFRIEAEEVTGVLDLCLGEGPPTRTRLLEIQPGLCQYQFTLVQPPNMPDVVWEQEGLPNLEEELSILQKQLEALPSGS